ncbi:MAG: ketoacyl-ACP synthase III [Muribaculum sp.]|nr:ketoacyl-ACP synthase III [Muribaculum sp.]
MIGKIEGTGSYAPAQIWDNNRLAEMVDTNDEWIRERTGIVKRHVAEEGETTAVIAERAAEAALDNAGVSAEEIDLIIVATTSPGNLVPNTACEVQRLLDASHATCFDLNGACTGFIFALNTAQAYIAQGIYHTALIVGAECLSNLTDWTDRSTCILFGDGAGAAVLRAVEEGHYTQVTHSVGSKGSVLTCACGNKRFLGEGEDSGAENPRPYLHMDGGEVFKFAVSKIPGIITEVLEREQTAVEEIDYFILHQANARIVSAVAKRLGLNLERFPMNIAEYGNTSSASIPILLDELNRAGKLKRGMKLVLAGFGGGLSYGASLIVW